MSEEISPLTKALIAASGHFETKEGMENAIKDAEAAIEADMNAAIADVQPISRATIARSHQELLSKLSHDPHAVAAAITLLVEWMARTCDVLAEDAVKQVGGA